MKQNKENQQDSLFRPFPMNPKSQCSIWIESYRGKSYVTRIIDGFGERFPETVPEPKRRRRKKGKEGG